MAPGLLPVSNGASRAVKATSPSSSHSRILFSRIWLAGITGEMFAKPEDGFDTFSHKKGVFYQSRFNAAGLLRPPYGGLIDRMLSFLIPK